MGKRIWTIDDLLEADEELIEECFKQVTILGDIEDYLKHIHENDIDLKVRTHMRRTKGRALGVHPSSACKKGVCPLKIYYECTGEVKPLRSYDPKMQEIWDLGTMLHDRMQYILEKIYGDQFEKEVQLSIPELLLVGHTDGVFEFSFAGIRIVLELKSIKEGGNFGWEKVQLKPMPDNVRQAHLYMKAKNIPFGIIIYMGKNNGEYKEHPIMFNPKIWKELEGVIIPVVKAVKTKNALVKAVPGWHCRYCDFEYKCQSGRRSSRAKRTTTWKRKRSRN